MNDSQTNADSVLRPHYKRLAHGVVSYVPPLYLALLRSAAFFRRGDAQEPQTSPRMHEMSGAYCYNVWLRHLIYAHMAGLNARPETVVELGPGRSLGVGVAALVSGSGRLHAVEPYDQPSIAANLAIFDELVGMFRRREPAIPYSVSGRHLSPAPCEFPYHILDEARLGKALEKSRLNAIRDSIRRGDGRILYHSASACDIALLNESSVDMVFSHHTLEHIEDLASLFHAIAFWLKPGGHTAHIINFDSHHGAKTWDGHWAWSELHWKLLRGRPIVLPTERGRNWESINRRPLSAYVAEMAQHGLETRHVEPETAEPGLPRRKMARKFRGMSEADRTTRTVFVLAQRTERK